MSELPKNCGDCRYYQPLEAQGGQCHRFPPVFAGDTSPREAHHWRYPAVGAHGWCGEFAAAQMSSSGVMS